MLRSHRFARKKLCIYFCVLPEIEARQLNVMNNIRELYTQKRFREIDIELFWAYTSKDNIESMSKYISPLMMEREQVRKYPNKVYCAISHAKIWEKVLNSGHEYAVIIEDDVIVHDNFVTDVLNIIKEIKEFDICFLWHHPHFERIRSDKYKYVESGYGIYGNICYILSRNGLVKLLNSLPFTDNKDYHIKRLVEEKKLQAFISKQDLVTNRGAVDSLDKHSELGSTIFN